jgi:hypothetical protein
MSKTFDLTTLNLSAGKHTITVKARASGYEDSPASSPVDYVVAGEETYTVSGTWVFNETIKPLPSSTPYEVNFTHKDDINRWTYIYIQNYGTNGVGKAYGLSAVSKTFVYSDEGNGSWNNENQRTITFDGVQEVSKEFYEWLLGNALKQGNIRFKIADHPHQAIEGMTWGEWVESEYNTLGYWVIDGLICISGMSGEGFNVEYANGDNVKPTDVIAVQDYQVPNGGGGSN